MEEQPRIILLTDAREMKKRQQKELAFYRQRIKELQARMDLIVREIQITEFAIRIIKAETTANQISIKT
jgi:hypothetical protein